MPSGRRCALSLDIGIFTDEISQDFELALDLVRQWGLRTVELRTVWHKNIVDLAPAELEAARSALVARGLTVSCIASPLFKATLRDGDLAPQSAGFYAAQTGARDQREVLARAISAASVLGAETIRAFSFWRQPDRECLRPSIATHLREAAGVAAEHGLALAIENEFSCNAGTGAEAAAALVDVGRGNLGVIWDLANALVLGETPFPDGYRALRGNIVAVHVKDCLKLAPTGEEPWRVLGQGDVDWPGQLQALIDDGFQGPITLEPHPIKGYCQVEAARLCLQSLRGMLAQVT